MDRLDEILSIVDFSLNTKRKRHIVGGVLMSAALLFASLSVTVVTLKTEEDYHDGRSYS